MELIESYAIADCFFQIEKAAAGNYIVTIQEYGQEDKHYSLQTEMEAYKFILDFLND